MSLTSMLGDKNYQELRDKFKADFIKPSFNLKTEIKAPPLTNNFGTVGTAFDYLMRFYLQYHNPKTFIQRDTWVADSSYKKLISLLSKTKQKKLRTGTHSTVFINPKYLLKLINEQYNQTKINYQKFVNDGLLSEDLIANTIFLAKLDVYFRSGIIAPNFDNHNTEDIKDIKALISLVDQRHFIAKEKCYFNPTFGEGSKLVGGADADLIIDNTLIDIKATKHLKLERDQLNQILGYYILSLIGGVNQNPEDKPIENIGIYFARHGELWTIPLLQLSEYQKFHNYKEWFVSFLEKKLTTEVSEFLESIDAKQKTLKRKVAEVNSVNGEELILVGDRWMNQRAIDRAAANKKINKI